jgi:hypothetical protein
LVSSVSCCCSSKLSGIVTMRGMAEELLCKSYFLHV